MAKILLVEDDNNLREIYEARLQAEGYDIVSAKDGEEALVIAKKERPDLIIADVMMPRVSGFEMADILRNTPELKDVHIIMLTALGQAEDKTRADSLGVDRYLVKSQVTLEDIVKAAADVLAGVPASAAPTATAAPAVDVSAPASPAPAPVAAVPVPVTTPPAEPVTPATPAQQDSPTAPAQTPPGISIPVSTPPADSVAAQSIVPPVANLPTPQDSVASTVPEPTGTDAQLVTDAVNNLVSGTPAAPASSTPPPSDPASAVVPVAPAPAPVSPAGPLTMQPVIAPPTTPVVPQPPVTPAAPATDPTVASNGSAIRKAITPLPAGSTTAPADLSELMAREGHTMDDTDAPEFGTAHAPGNVITPGGTPAGPAAPSPNPTDPNSISL